MSNATISNQHSGGPLVCNAKACVRTSYASLRVEVLAEKSYSQVLQTSALCTVRISDRGRNVSSSLL